MESPPATCAASVAGAKGSEALYLGSLRITLQNTAVRLQALQSCTQLVCVRQCASRLGWLAANAIFGVWRCLFVVLWGCCRTIYCERLRVLNSMF